MALEVRFSRAAAKRFQRLTGDLRSRIATKIREIAEDPLLKGSEQLSGQFGARRVRVGGWRIIYTWTPDQLTVEEIGSGGQVYRDFLGRG